MATATTKAILSSGSYKLFDHEYGGWRLLVPALAGLMMLMGLIDAFYRANRKGASVFFGILRLSILAELGVSIASYFKDAPSHLPMVNTQLVAVTVLAPAYITIGAGIVGLLISMASASKTGE